MERHLGHSYKLLYRKRFPLRQGRAIGGPVFTILVATIIFVSMKVSFGRQQRQKRRFEIQSMLYLHYIY